MTRSLQIDGLPHSFKTQGRGEPIVFGHGGSGRKEWFDPLLALLPAERVLAGLRIPDLQPQDAQGVAKAIQHAIR